MGVTRLFLPLGQYSWHLFYRLLSLEWGEGRECFNLLYVLCLKKKTYLLMKNITHITKMAPFSQFLPVSFDR